MLQVKVKGQTVIVRTVVLPHSSVGVAPSKEVINTVKAYAAKNKLYKLAVTCDHLEDDKNGQLSILKEHVLLMDNEKEVLGII